MSVCVVFGLLALAPGLVSAGASQLAEISELCCNKGTLYALGHGARDCPSAAPPDVPTAFGDFCKFAMDQCCKEYFDKNRDCNDGISEAARSDNCDALPSDTGKNCCKQCLRGTTTGKSKGICVGGSRGSSADEFLPTEAFENCCKNATKYEFNTNEDARGGSEPWRKPVPLSTGADLSSLCEEYAPHELCAHHCIPAPGSYRCECNPGYKLMADGKNCMETVKNRCKPRNPCQHKCQDNGVEMKCTCRRGYELQADGKSCKDIDECQVTPPLCLPSTECRNTRGSYKCIPKKTRVADNGQCPPGFVKNPVNFACDDINECTLINPPCPSYLCENTVGGYKCGGISGDPSHLGKSPPPMEDRCPSGFKAVMNGRTEECEDVDECEARTDDCNQLSQFCINTKGSFFCQDQASRHCPPGFKNHPDTNKCEDIDECLDSETHSLCPSDKICVNVPGAYDCKAKIDYSLISQDCPDGFRKNPATSRCEDIDECLEGIHLCDQHQSCLNTNGSHECRCKLGFELDSITGACTDINECATDQNKCAPESQRCENTAGSYFCVRFISCGTGYTLHHASNRCEDIDECALGKDNCARAGPNYECHNIPGFFRCVRRAPPSTSTTPEPEYEYYDSDDEFFNETNSVNNEDPKNDNKVDQTLTTTQRTVTEAAPTPSSTASTKPTENIPAVVLERKDEEIIPKLEDNNRPDDRINDLIPPENRNEEVPVIDQRKTEIASTGETVDKDIESPDIDPNDYVKQPYYNTINEPSSNVSKQTEVKSDTSNNEANQVEDKTTPHIVLLEVPNETATVQGKKTEDGALVVNTQDVPKNEWIKINERPGAGNCQSGFEMDDYGACVDIDECATNRHVCSGLTEVCRNNMGGYICECAAGFRRDLRTGACDLIPTTTSTTTAAPGIIDYRNRGIFSPYRPPITRPFHARTLCDFGFNMNASTGKCEDVDECTNGQSACAEIEICVNTQGGYRCDCHPNWRYDEGRHKCVPKRDRTKFPTGYGNVPGRSPVQLGTDGLQGRRHEEPTLTRVAGQGAVLKCRFGYQLGDDNSCEDIDECALGTAQCGPDQLCTNLLGGYTCACPPGHNLVGDHACRDVDECDLAGDTPICSQNADCINTVGSYQCKCHEGFRPAPANDKVCVDVDECSEARSGSLCQHRCYNIWGGYRCSCHRGYRLNEDNRTCSDVDECSELQSKRLCAGRCVNEPGGYKCACPSGYKLSQDKRSCIDIDECETGEAFCAAPVSGKAGSNFCFNIRGSYKCEKISCPQGYRLENRHRCTKVDTSCRVGDWECIHQPSTYSYNYITFVSFLDLPAGKVDLYTMSVPAWPKATTKFNLRLVTADSPPTVKARANIDSFLLTTTAQSAVVSIVQSLEGPQSIELELSMELYSGDSFAGIAVAKLFLYVSEYEF
ncbi:fibulin-2 [Plutella xylostella]|uniref:fibulin-2 n=1 Tax=Plutella xylostella TaxID=51655 RepID=UPI0020328548|nr:fibulin-2 [Plutella xylostella]